MMRVLLPHLGFGANAATITTATGTRAVYLLKRMISCLSTVFMDSSYMTGYFSITASVSKSAGSLDRMSSESSSTTACVRADAQ